MFMIFNIGYLILTTILKKRVSDVQLKVCINSPTIFMAVPNDAITAEKRIQIDVFVLKKIYNNGN